MERGEQVSDPKRVYWDTDVTQSWIDKIPERVALLRDMLAASANPNVGFEIVTSQLTIAEVAYSEAEKVQLATAADANEHITAFWESSVVKLIEVHMDIAMEARLLLRHARGKGWSLRSVDALHLASAKWKKVDAVHSYDKRLYKYHEILGIPIYEPDRLLLPMFSAQNFFDLWPSES